MKHLQYVALLFGLFFCPKSYIKTLVVLAAALFIQRLCLVPYLDDWLLEVSSLQIL